MGWVNKKQKPVKSVSEQVISPKSKLKVLGLNTDDYYVPEDKGERIWDRIRPL